MATIASLVVNIAADTSDLKRNVEGISGTMSRLESIAGAAGKALISAFAVTAVVGAARQVLNFADSLQAMSDKTGISAEGLQRLDRALNGSGVSVAQVTDNIARLSKNLIGGDKSAVGALEKLGLNVNQLKTLSADKLFLTVADAVGQIQNPTERAYAAMTIFGKGGAGLLQGLTGHLTETAAAAKGVIPNETIRAADAFGDQLELLGKQLIAALAQGLTPLLPALMQLAKLLGNVLSVIGPVIGAMVDFTVKGVLYAWKGILQFLSGAAELATRIPILGKHLGFAGDAALYLGGKAEETDRYIKSLSLTTATSGASAHTATPAVLGLGDAVEKVGKSADDAARREAQWIKAVMENNQRWSEETVRIEKNMLDVRRDLEQKFYDEQVRMAEASGKQLLQTTIDLNQSIIGLDAERMRNLLAINTPGMFAAGSDVGRPVGENFAQSLMGGVKSGLSGLGGTILGAFQGGGNVLKSIGSSFGLGFTQQTFGSKAFQGVINGAFGTAVGGMLNSVLPGIGALAGPLLSKLGDLFAGIGGPSKQEKAGRSASDQFTASLQSSLDWMQQIEVHQLVAAGNSEKFATQLVAIRDGFAKAGHTADEVNDVINRLWAAEKLGGNAVQQVIDEITIKLHDTLPAAADNAATQTLHAFDEITSAAMSTADAVAQAATDAFNAWAQTYKYMRAGGSNVDPTKQALSPENYASYDDWLKAFVHFNPGDEGRAASAYASNSFAALGGFVTDSGIQYLAGGGGIWPWMSKGTDTVPAMLTPGEGVLSRDGMKALAALNRGGSLAQKSDVYVYVTGTRPDDIINAMRAKGVRFSSA